MAMARMPSFVVPGAPLHVTQWSNDGGSIFSAVQDRAAFLLDLSEAAALHGCAIHAYVLMVTHVRLLLTPAEADGPRHLMQTLGRRHARYGIRRYARPGGLHDGRLRSAALDPDRRFLACSRLIEMSPVRAGLVSEPAAYAWSSFGFNGHGARDAVLTPHPVYLALGATNAERQQAYRSVFAGPLDGRPIRSGSQRPVGTAPAGGPLPGRTAANLAQAPDPLL
jgi:putative transposase